MPTHGLKKLVALIGRKTGEGRPSHAGRGVRHAAHLIAVTTGAASSGKLRQHAGKITSKVMDKLFPGRGFHLRKSLPIVLMAAALAESAHAPLMKGAKAMAQNSPGAPRVQASAGDAGQTDKTKSDMHGPGVATDQPLVKKQLPRLEDFRVIDPPQLLPDQPMPYQPITLTPNRGGTTVVIGPTNGGGGGGVFDPIVHGGVIDGGGGQGGGGAGGGGAGGGGTGGGGGGGNPNPKVFSPTVTPIATVPEPSSITWVLAGGYLLRRRNHRSKSRHPAK